MEMAAEWQSQKFRQHIVAKIDLVLQNSSQCGPKNARFVEKQLFKKAKSKDEYLALVAKRCMFLLSRTPQQATDVQDAETPEEFLMQQKPLYTLQDMDSESNFNAHMEEEWQSQQFRQSVIEQINEMLQNTGQNGSKNACVMEHEIFMNSQNEDEYMHLLAMMFMSNGPQQAPPHPNEEMAQQNMMQGHF